MPEHHAAVPRPYTHVIFDLDGTLLNTLNDLAAAGNHVCALHGWPAFPIDAYRRKVGNGMRKLVERIIPSELQGDAAALEAALSEFRSYYAKHSADRTTPYAGIPAALDELRDAGVTLAVLTNKDHTSAVPLIAQQFGSERFACVQGRVEAFPPKPAAPITEHVMRKLDAAPATTLYVGDSDVDVQCGHNAGLPVAGVTWGFRGRTELEGAGADFVVDTPAELVSLVLGTKRDEASSQCS